MIYPAPSYLINFVTGVNNKLLAEVQCNYGDNTTVFKFNSNFRQIIQTWNEAFEEYGGTIWGVDTAGMKITFFDPFSHGYNGNMQVNDKEDINSIRTINLSEGTEIIIAFQYSGDEAEYIEEGISKFEQDYFGWVVIYKLLNDRLEEVFNYECA